MTSCQFGSRLSRSKLPPGWRPAAQTRASGPTCVSRPPN